MPPIQKLAFEPAGSAKDKTIFHLGAGRKRVRLISYR